MNRSVISTAVAVAAVCLLGSACSKSSPKSAGAATTPQASKAAATTGDSGGGGGPTCKQLTFAQVQPLIDITVISLKTTALNINGTGQQCEFDAKGSDSTGAITVQVLRGSGGTQAYAQAVSGEGKPVAVPGVGDKASRDTEDGAVNALKGDLFCSVSYASSDQIPGVGPLEEAHGATNNIGENYYDTIAQAMGTLCNRIYGRGNTTPDLSSLLSAAATASPSDDGGLPSATLPTDGPSS
jgi:hypothetical protein